MDGSSTAESDGSSVTDQSEIDEDGQSSPWNQEEKELLLKGLRKYSSKDIPEISSLIPSRSEEEIKKAIEFYRHRLVYEKSRSRKTCLPITHWANKAAELVKCAPSPAKALATALEALEHSCKDKDTPTIRYSAMYSYLKCLIRQDPVESLLTQHELALIWDVLCRTVCALTDSTQFGEEQLYLTQKSKEFQVADGPLYGVADQRNRSSDENNASAVPSRDPVQVALNPFDLRPDFLAKYPFETLAGIQAPESPVLTTLRPTHSSPSSENASPSVRLRPREKGPSPLL